MKPRVRFCWECGRKLRGNHFVEMLVDGHLRVLHKDCAAKLKQGVDSPCHKYDEVDVPGGHLPYGGGE